MDPLIIEVAVNGGRQKNQNPNVPKTPEEVASDTLACLAAGASVIHTHIEDIMVNGKEAAERYAQAHRPILKERPDAILYATGAAGDTIEERCVHVGLLAEEGLQFMEVVDPGTMNLSTSSPDGLPGKTRMIYASPFPWIEYQLAHCGQYGLGPSLAIYEPSFLRATLLYHRAGRMPPGALVKFYFGGDGNFMDHGTFQFSSLPPTRKALDAYLEMFGDCELPWSATVMGGDVTMSGMSKLAIERGGHVRVGLEDYVGPRKPSNVELVKEVAEIARALGRPVATPEQAKKILNLPR